MQKIFLNILDMSIVASIVILAVLVVRLFLKRAPKRYSYILWAVVLFRLLCPFSIEGAFSIIPERAQNIPLDLSLETFEYVSPIHVIDATQRAVGDTLNGGIDTVWVRLNSEDVGYQGISQASHLQVWLLFAGVLWPIGIMGMVVYSGVSYVKLRRRLVGAVCLCEDELAEEQQNRVGWKKQVSKRIYLADHISTPFVMGILQPKIYLPSSLQESEREYIILHEQHHIRRGDHIVKFIAFVALCIHWFNPLVWVAFVQAGKDMEMSCDEAVIKSLGAQIRASYSASLLKLAIGKTNFAGMPLAFGEGDTKGRIQNLAKWKQPKLWISMIAVLVCIIVAVVCIVNPESKSNAPAKVVGEYDASRLGGAYLESGNPAYEIGANIYGKPVFVDAAKAFKAMKEEYSDALELIREQFDLSSITKRNYDAYKVYGAQVMTEDESLRKKCVAVSQLLDIYENSFEYGSKVDGIKLVEGGLLGYTVPMPDENHVILSKESVFVPGTSYVTYDCAYMTPLSSTLSNGDDGYRYVVGENTFTKTERSSGSEKVYNVTWEWQPFLWTDEEYREMYLPGLAEQVEISKYYDEMWYQPITEGYCLLWLDGQLYLMKLNKIPQKTPYVWSVFLLMPESLRNVSQPISLSLDMTKYLGMSYQQFQENYQNEVINYHANFYLAQIQEGDFNVIFNASGYDDKTARAVLTETDEIFRVDSKLGTLLPEFTEEMTVEGFLKRILGREQVSLEHYIRQGGGTIYYVGNTYVEIGLDSDGDKMADMILDVTVDEENQIGPESRVWLIKSVVLSTTHP